MAAATAPSSNAATPKHNGPRRKRMGGPRRRMGGEEDDGSDDHEGRGDSAVDLVNEDSLTDGSTASDGRELTTAAANNSSNNNSDTGRVKDNVSPAPSPASASTQAAQGSGRKVPGSRDGKRGHKGIGMVPGVRAPRRPSSAAESRASDAVPRGDAVSAVVAAARRAESTPPSRQQLAASTAAVTATAETAATAATATTHNATESKAPSATRTPTPKPKAPQPAIVSSSAAAPVAPDNTPPAAATAAAAAAEATVGSQQTPRASAYERQRREHDLYRQRRDEDPAFVPNRGAFFMHDHRGAGPAANGFRPFGRPGRGGRGGRGGFAAPMYNQFQNQADPTVNAPWTHDMHDVVARPSAARVTVAPRRQNFETSSQYGGSQMSGVAAIPTCPSSAVPINRAMSVEKLLGTMTIRVLIPPMREPVTFEKFKVMQYTKLPDHRPPLRRDKAVIIDLPGHAKHQIFPAVDRSFIFIPRALRPNQQRSRGSRTRSSVMGSISGFSRRTSMYGGSYYNGSIYNGSIYNGSVYNGSVYTPSVAPSRRSSIAQDVGREFIVPPAMDSAAGRPVVRLPPSGGFGPQPPGPMPMPMSVPMAGFAQPFQPAQQRPPQPQQPQQPLVHPLPPRPPYQETRPSQNLVMHQPQPQKALSLENIEAPAAAAAAASSTLPQPYSNAFHQQMPMPMAGNGVVASGTGESHSRHPSSSHPSHTTGTPLSQIPERAIHAAPFQPSTAGQNTVATAPAGPPGPPGPTGPPVPPAYYGPPGGNYTVMQATPQQPYYYAGPSAPGPGGYVPAVAPGAPVSNMVGQEINGMVYYMNAPPVQPSYAAYQQPVAMPGGYMPGGMGGMVGGEQYYYGPVYYPQ